MVEPGETPLTTQKSVEGSAGKVQANPEHPLLKTGRLEIDIHVTTDGIVFTNKDKALAYQEHLNEATGVK